ncbi:MAG: hypothetical protein PHC38_08640 [Weeksellaceae bacterium]|nr:hypothetical protein [Weeksellaceae bacterium]
MNYTEEYMDKHYKRTKCINCGKTFWKRKKSYTSLRSKADIKPANAVTCCRKCSREYVLIKQKRFREKMKREAKKNEKPRRRL